jgi:hypothetical protein
MIAEPTWSFSRPGTHCLENFLGMVRRCSHGDDRNVTARRVISRASSPRLCTSSLSKCDTGVVIMWAEWSSRKGAAILVRRRETPQSSQSCSLPYAVSSPVREGRFRDSLMKHVRTPWKKSGSASRHGAGPTAIIREIHYLPVLRAARLTHPLPRASSLRVRSPVLVGN